MIKIRRGNQVATVTMGAFKAVFKNQGWEIYEGKSSMPKKPRSDLGMKLPDPDDEDTTQDENVQEDEDDEDIAEKPLSTMTMAELQELASRYDIDTEGMRTKKEIRTAIREAMEEGE